MSSLEAGSGRTLPQTSLSLATESSLLSPVWLSEICYPVRPTARNSQASLLQCLASEPRWDMGESTEQSA